MAQDIQNQPATPPQQTPDYTEGFVDGYQEGFLDAVHQTVSRLADSCRNLPHRLRKDLALKTGAV